LGIFAYELIVGHPPFTHENDNVMFDMIKKNNVKFSPNVEISPEARDFIEKVFLSWN